MFEKEEEEEVFGCVREGGKCGVTKSFDPPPPSFLPFLAPPLGQEGRIEIEGESLFFLPEGVANEKEEKEEKRKIGGEGARIKLLISPFTHAGLPTHLNEPSRIKSKCAANFETLSGDNFLIP